MERQIKQIKQFYNVFKIPHQDGLTTLMIERQNMRMRLLREEVDELADAYNSGDIVEIADAITDCLYILLGTALEHGMLDVLPELFDEVHRSNMTKLDSLGKPILREDGKILKSELFQKPELWRVLALKGK